MKVSIEEYIATNNTRESMLFVYDNGLPKPKNMADLIHKMRYILKHKKDAAFERIAEIDTPYKRMILAYNGTSSSSFDANTETASKNNGCEDVEKKSNCSGCSGADGGGCPARNAFEKGDIAMKSDVKVSDLEKSQRSSMVAVGALGLIVGALVLSK